MLWTQIGDQRVQEIPADGATAVDIYSAFYWDNAILDPNNKAVGPYLINFAVGQGQLPTGEDVPPIVSSTDLLRYLTPIEGVELESDTASPQYTAVPDENGQLSVLPVARVRLKPVSRTDVSNLLVVSWTTYDKLGQIKRFAYNSQPLTFNTKLGDSTTFLNVVEKYDVAANKWTTVAPMRLPRVGPMVIEANGLIHVFGGYDGVRFMPEHEAYDPATNTWADKARIQIAGEDVPLAFGSCFSYGGKVYLVGGLNQGYTSARFLCYDPVADTFSELPGLPQAVAMGSVSVVGNYAYVMFGATKVMIGSQVDEISRFNLGVFKYDLTAASPWTIEKLAVAPEGRILSGAIVPGQVSISTAVSPTAPYGVAVINDGQPNEEIICFYSNTGKGPFKLTRPAVLAHNIGEPFAIRNMPENRVGPNTVASGTTVNVSNGMSFYGYDSKATFIMRGVIGHYDTLTQTYTTSGSTVLPRARAAQATVGTDTFIIGGSADKSEWLDDVEKYLVGDMGRQGHMLYPKHSFGAAASGAYVYACGGAGSGHEPGWLQITVTANPERVRADGKQTSSILVSAFDASGDPPPEGTQFSFKGYISVLMSDTQKKQFTDQLTAQGVTLATPATTGTSKTPPQRVSILPVLFSSNQVGTVDGQAATILFERSEDPINEVDKLFEFELQGEAPQAQEQLKQLATGLSGSLKKVTAGQARDLYSAFIEANCVDSFYFGTTNTDLSIYLASQAGEINENGEPSANATAAQAVGSEVAQGLGTTSFGLVRKAANQKLSANVTFYSDIASIPDVQEVTDSPVSGDEAKTVLNSLQNDIPFGASPHYDALELAISTRANDTTSPRPKDLIISTSDNEQSLSAYTPSDVVDAANAIAGKDKTPVFVTDFIVTDPISLAARRARTDVSALEQISSETGGNSFSVVSPSYIDFVINRIETSAPSSLSSCLVIGTYELGGAFSEVQFVVGNYISGNSAQMTLFVSDDNYNYEDLGVFIEPNDSGVARFVFSTPITKKYLRFSLTMSSKTFRSPKLQSITFTFVKPNVQYLFTYPQIVFGQVAELAGIVNHRLPEGCTVEMGLTHGESFVFDRDYKGIPQPAIKERGVILVINRSFDTYLGEDSTRDTLITDDLYVYKSQSGPWKGTSLQVFFNGDVVDPSLYKIYPERGAVVFSFKLRDTDVVQIGEVVQPNRFRVGLKITNPTLFQGRLDDFAYSWTGTEDAIGGRANSAPRAINLLITPQPAIPAGPMTANYTFVDPDGDAEDKTLTLIIWFRNGVPIPALNNKQTISNNDFVSNQPSENGIAKGQEWYFTVKPSDGKAYGPLATSPKVVIANQPPRITKATLVSTNDDPLVFTTSDTVKVDSTFFDADADKPSQFIYTWFINGGEAKSGSDNAITPTEKDTGGNRLLSPGNTVSCEIIPFDGQDYGDPFATDQITVQAAPPVVSEVVITPSSPSLLSNLRLTYKYDDPDSLPDKSNIRWLRDGTRVSELDNIKQVSRVLLAAGQEWQAIVTPSNGLAEGEDVQSNTVEVTF